MARLVIPMYDCILMILTGFRLNWVTNTWKSPTGMPRDPPLAAFGEVCYIRSLIDAPLHLLISLQTQAEELAQYFLSLPVEERPTALLSSGFCTCGRSDARTST
jgi:transcription factor C subunit 7